MASPELIQPDPQLLVQDLRTTVFDPHSPSPQYLTEIAAQGLAEYGVHTALAQLYFLYRDNLGPYTHGRATFTGRVVEEPMQKQRTPRAKEARFRGTPADIFSLIEQDSCEASQKIGYEVDQRIQAAQRILLCGSILPTSTTHTLAELHKKGFTGKLTVADLASGPLALVEAYQRHCRWSEQGIEVETITTDLLQTAYGAGPLQAEVYDLAIADVLGHYYTDYQLAYNLRGISSLVRRNGLLLARDMEEYTEFEDNERVLLGTHDTVATEEDRRFREWLWEHFRYEVPLEEIIHMRTHLFPAVAHPNRGGYIGAMWERALDPYSFLRYQLNTVPESPEPPKRFFKIMVFEKEIKKYPEKVTSFGHACSIE